MSGLWVRPHMGAGQDGFRGECSKQPDSGLKQPVALAFYDAVREGGNHPISRYD